MVMVRLVFGDENTPSAKFDVVGVDLERMRGDGAPSRSLCRVAIRKAEPAMVAEREPPVPSPKNTSSVSPCT